MSSNYYSYVNWVGMTSWPWCTIALRRKFTRNQVLSFHLLCSSMVVECSGIHGGSSFKITLCWSIRRPEDEKIRGWEARVFVYPKSVILTSSNDLRRATGEVRATKTLLATTLPTMAAVPAAAPPTTAPLPAAAWNRGSGGAKPRGEEQRRRGEDQRRWGAVVFLPRRGARACHTSGESWVPGAGSERTFTGVGSWTGKNSPLRTF
jgi:hypothetical protein